MNLYKRIFSMLALSFVLNIPNFAFASDPLMTFDYKNTNEIQKSILLYNSKNVVNHLLADESQWQFVMNNISQGNPEWVQVAATLLNGSDAGSTEMIINALGEALEHNPTSILKANFPPSITLNQICGSPDIDDKRYDSYQLAINAIEIRKESILGIHDSNMTQVSTQCVKFLEESKHGIASFYAVNGTKNKK